MQAPRTQRSIATPLESKRLLLCAPAPEHCEQLYQAILTSFAQLQPWMAWASRCPEYRFVESYLLEAQRRFAAGEEFPLLLIDKAAQKVIGGSGIHEIDWHVPKAEIGYWLHSEFYGRGLMSEAVGCVCDAGFEQLGLQRIEIKTSEHNSKSQAIARRLGFVQEGVLRNDRREFDGRLSSTIVFAKTNSS